MDKELRKAQNTYHKAQANLIKERNRVFPVLPSNLRSIFVRAANETEAAEVINYLRHTDHYKSEMFYECPYLDHEPIEHSKDCLFYNFN